MYGYGVRFSTFSLPNESVKHINGFDRYMKCFSTKTINAKHRATYIKTETSVYIFEIYFARYQYRLAGLLLSLVIVRGGLG